MESADEKVQKAEAQRLIAVEEKESLESAVSLHASYGAPTLAHRAPPARSLGCHGLLHLAAQTVLVQRAALGTRRLPRPPACSKLGAR